MADKQNKSREFIGMDFAKPDGDFTAEMIVNEAKSVGELTYKLGIDVSDALTGIKALKREAREVTQALKELECQYKYESKHDDDVNLKILGDTVKVEKGDLVYIIKGSGRQ